MNWKNFDDVSSVAMETIDVGGAYVPGNKLIEWSILHENFVAKNKELRSWIPVHTNSVKRHVTGSESG